MRSQLIKELRALSPLSLPQRKELWEGSPPDSIQFHANVNGNAVFISGDSAATNFGDQILDRISTICNIFNVLGSVYVVPIAVDLITFDNSYQVSLDKRLAEENSRRDIRSAIRQIIIFLASVMLGTGLTMLVK